MKVCNNIIFRQNKNGFAWETPLLVSYKFSFTEKISAGGSDY